MNTTTTLFALGFAGFVTVATGCMTNPDSSPDFGASVAAMARQQTYDPGAATVAPEDSMAPVDGGAVDRVITGYREAAVPKGDTIQNEIHINVGN